MKIGRIKLFLVVLLAIPLFDSCSSDDDPGSDGSLLGDWQMTNMDYDGETETNFQGIPITTTFEGVGKNLDVVMTFTESPNEFVTSGSYDVELTFSVFGQTETETTSIEDFESDGTWSLAGEKLTLDGSLFALSFDDEPVNDDSFEVTIEELTQTTLRLSMKATEEFTQDGVDVSATITSSLVFTRE